MAESYSVRAILSAQDKGFSSAMKNASSSLDSLGSKIRSGFNFGFLTGAGQQAFNMLVNGARSLISEIDSSNAAWKTFEGNMKILGKTDAEIEKATKTMQEYAEQTVYSSSDMAQTYAQLEAVGTKNTAELVKGFGGLAAAAENPQQAMKTLSQQATQMASKPKVAWEDFKLMLEQSPAGMAAVAKEMGMTTAEMVAKIQSGEIATTDFFAAIEKVGNSEGFASMATEAKTVGQAMDGLKETLGNKLLPAFEVLSQIGIQAVDAIAAKVGALDGEAIATKVSGWVEQAKPYWEEFKKVAADVGEAIKAIGAFLGEHGDTISKVLPYVLGLMIAFKGYKIIKSLIPGVSLFTSTLGKLAGKGIGALAGKLFGISKGQQAVGDTSATTGTQMLTSAKSMLLMGAAVLLVAAGFALLAFSAISLANAGPLAIGVMAGLVVALAALGFGMVAVLKTLAPMAGQLMPVATAMLAMAAAVVLISAGFAILAFSAITLANAGWGAIAVMVGMVAAIALLAVGAAALGTALTAGAVGFIAFGVAILAVGAGILLASAGMALLATQLPIIAQYGLQAALSIAALGAAMLVFGAGALVAGAGLTVAAVGLTVFGVAAIAASVGVLAFGVAMTTGAAGTLLMVAALKGVKSQMKSIASSAKTAQKSLKSMRSTIKVVESGLDGLGSKAKEALNKLTNAFDNSASKAKASGQKVGKGFTQGVQGGLMLAPAVAKSGVAMTISALNSGRSGAYQAGAYISMGFAQGMLSCLGTIRNAASQMAAAAEAAVRAKAKIQSPSKVAAGLGEYWGEGYAEGLSDSIKRVWNAAQNLVSVPNLATPNLAMAYGGELSGDYSYFRNNEYVIEVPLAVDGKEIARATAKYTQSELDTQHTRNERKYGRV